METFVLVQNPNLTAVSVDLSLQTDGGLLQPAELQGVNIPANSRETFNLGLYKKSDVNNNMMNIIRGLVFIVPFSATHIIAATQNPERPSLH